MGRGEPVRRIESEDGVSDYEVCGACWEEVPEMVNPGGAVVWP